MAFMGTNPYEELRGIRQSDMDIFLSFVKSSEILFSERHRFTTIHQRSVGSLARQYALSMGFPPIVVDLYGLSGDCHDYGKIAILDILEDLEGKTILLESDEMRWIKRHTIIGWRFVHAFAESMNSKLSESHITILRLLSDAMRSHHERIDGKGYPDGLSGKSIPLIARVLAVADAIEAMGSIYRTWRDPLSKRAIIDEINKNMGIQFDIDIAKNFISIIEKGNIGYPGVT